MDQNRVSEAELNMGDDFSTQALMNFDDFTNVERGLDETENINTENIDTDDSETFHSDTETSGTEALETEIIKTEIINTQFNRITDSEKTNTESESSHLDETVMKIDESTQVQDTTGWFS